MRELLNLYEKLCSNTFVIAGPCVIDDWDVMTSIAKEIVRLQAKYNIPIIFKASFDKANRTSISSYRGPGLEKGLEILRNIKNQFNLHITTDVHEEHQVENIAEVADIIQIPAFLCRQTDLLVAVARAGRIVNIKKGQFLSGADMTHPALKVAQSDNSQILLTERGNMYGYNNLVVDFRNITEMKKLGYPVIMDCTHSVQRPSAAGDCTSGDREYVPPMALAAKAFGADGYFFEVHPDPDKAKCDGPNSLYLHDLEKVISELLNDKADE